MLRVLVLMLLLANAGLYAWHQGWLGEPPRSREREPQRLAAQQRPEAVVVVSAQQASAALRAAREAASVCVETLPLAEPELGQAEFRLAEALVAPDAVSRSSVQVDVTAWIVHAGRYPEASRRNAREAELRRLGLAFERLASPPELAPGLVLSRHATREAAEAALRRSVPPALRGVRVEPLSSREARTSLRVAQVRPEVAERLKAAGGFALCVGASPSSIPSASPASPAGAAPQPGL